MQYSQRITDSVLRWQEIPEHTAKTHNIIFSVLATDGCASHTGDLHITNGIGPFLTNSSGLAIVNFTPTHFTKDHLIPFA